MSCENNLDSEPEVHRFKAATVKYGLLTYAKFKNQLTSIIIIIIIIIISA